MLILLSILVTFLGTTVYSQTPPKKCIHENSELLAADVVISKLLHDLDTNNDQIVTAVELVVEFLGNFDTNGDSRILREEFVPKWHSLYRDVPDFADYLFDHFDRNNDGMLGLGDIPILEAITDVDNDGRTSDVEFTLFMTHLYLDCVPHAHKPPTK